MILPCISRNCSGRQNTNFSFMVSYISICLASRDKLYSGDNTTIIPRGCRLGDQFHLAGSSWYPYLPPNGFDKCTICACNSSLNIECTRNKCPPLTCSEKVAYRPDKTSCCPKCPEVCISVRRTTKNRKTIPRNCC